MLNEVEKKTLLCLRKIKWFYSVETQQQHTIISTLVWLHVSVSSRQSSGMSSIKTTLAIQARSINLFKILRTNLS